MVLTSNTKLCRAIAAYSCNLRKPYTSLLCDLSTISFPLCIARGAYQSGTCGLWSIEFCTKFPCYVGQAGFRTEGSCISATRHSHKTFSPWRRVFAQLYGVAELGAFAPGLYLHRNASCLGAIQRGECGVFRGDNKWRHLHADFLWRPGAHGCSHPGSSGGCSNNPPLEVNVFKGPGVSIII